MDHPVPTSEVGEHGDTVRRGSMDPWPRRLTVWWCRNRSGRPIDAVDLASIPLFVGTMIAEGIVLRRRARRSGIERDGAAG